MAYVGHGLCSYGVCSYGLYSYGLFSYGLIDGQNVPEFYALRLVLGTAEAGFFPGLIVYMKQWFG